MKKSMKTKRRFSRLVGVFLLAGSALGTMVDAGELTPKAGDLFPDLGTFGLEGDLPATLKGSVVIVDFWASWCAPCKDTFPLLEELHHRFSKQGLIILGINEDKNRLAMTEFLKDHPVTFSVVRDAKKKLAAHVNVPALPTSYVLNGAGRIVLIESGRRLVHDRKAFVRQIEELLRKEAGGKP